MKVAVFCSCAADVSPMLLSEIERLGAILAEDGHDIVYGGAKSGCMGALAHGVRSRGGRLIGVLPRLEMAKGWAFEHLDECHEVEDLSARKVRMNDLADAFVVFPGGIGTLDEAFEVLAVKSLGSYSKPVIFYNFLDVWTPLLEAMVLLAEQRLIRHPLEDLLVVLDKSEAVRDHLNQICRN